MNSPYQTTLMDAPSSKSVRPKIQGANHADDFQTPPDTLLPLLPYLEPGAVIWEPCCGAGNLCGELSRRGFVTIETDLNPAVRPIDGAHDALAWEPSCGFDALITNPPYTLKDEFIARCYQLGKPWALLLPYTTFEGLKRQELFRRNGVEVIFLPRRPKFTTPSGKVGGSWFPVAWFTHGLNIGQALTFWEGE